jgi:hypothetical protein
VIPGGLLDLARGRVHPHKDSDVEVDAERDERHNVALVPGRVRVDALQKDPQRLHNQDHIQSNHADGYGYCRAYGNTRDNSRPQNRRYQPLGGAT